MNVDKLSQGQFDAAVQEHRGNFYFVAKHDPKLYNDLFLAESNSLVNLLSAGGHLRNALEHFQETAMPDALMPEVYARYAEVLHVKPSKSARTVDYGKIFGRHPELRVKKGLFDAVREGSNPFHHNNDLKNPSTKPRTYKVLCEALAAMQKMLYYYYTGTENIKYRRSRQPIDGYWVCTSSTQVDNTACERQALCVKGQNERAQYCLLRQYAAGNLDEDAIRDEKVLNSLWSPLRKPRNIIQYRVLPVEYGGDAPKQDKKRLLCYDFGNYRPYPLNTEMIAALSEEQKIRLLHDLANGVWELHQVGICHRNLQPNSVFVFFEHDSDFLLAKLVGFEYAKIKGDAKTVYNSVKELYAVGDPSAYISNTMQAALNAPAAAARIDWQKEDIYSLGALFHLILTGKPPVFGRPAPELAEKTDPVLLRLVTQMLDPVPMRRPTAGDVCRVTVDFYHLVEEEY